jgi:hypothetical protein
MESGGNRLPPPSRRHAGVARRMDGGEHGVRNRSAEHAGCEAGASVRGYATRRGGAPRAPTVRAGVLMSQLSGRRRQSVGLAVGGARARKFVNDREPNSSSPSVRREPKSEVLPWRSPRQKARMAATWASTYPHVIPARGWRLLAVGSKGDEDPSPHPFRAACVRGEDGRSAVAGGACVSTGEAGWAGASGAA